MDTSQNPTNTEEFLESLTNEPIPARDRGAKVGGTGQSIDEYLAATKGRTNIEIASQGMRTKSMVDKPSDLQLKVRIELSDMNRAQRRAWLAQQSREAGKIRRRYLTAGKGGQK